MQTHTLRRKSKTETVLRRCHRCHGSGFAPCPVCGGSGKLLRGSDADGHPVFGKCEGCFGRKTTRCKLCHGEHFI